MARASGSISRTFVWILLALLIAGLAGFGAVGLSGTVRTVGAVGDKNITVDAYVRALRNEIRATEAQRGAPLTFQQAQSMGIDTQALGRLITARSLDNEAADMGLSIGDAELVQQLSAISAFQGPDGSFDRDSYRFALQNAGMTEAEFEEDLRDEAARTLLQSAIVGGNAMPDTYVATIIAYAGERRDISWATLDDGDLATGLAVPDDAALQAYYDENIGNYTRPEVRRISYAWLTPEMIVDTVEIDQTALRAAYDERAAEFILPERRLVERLAFADEPAADTARGRIDAGEVSFEALVTDRGLDLADIDLGDVTREDLDDAADAIFDAQPGDVVGPLPSDLGPALFRVNAVLPAQETTFDEAEPQLRDELATDRARRVIEAQMQEIDDLLAGGATIEDLADETEMQSGQIDWEGAEGDGIAAYDGFREVAAAATLEDFPEVEELGDGGIFAMRIDEVLPPAPRPFEEVRDQVAQGWERAQVTDALEAQAQDLAARLGEGRTFQSLDLTVATETDLTRNGFVRDLPPGAIPAAFDMEPGDVRVIPGNGSATILQLNAVRAADPTDDEVAALAEALREQAAAALAQDIFAAFAEDIRTRAGLRLDQQALNAVHASFQ